MSVIAAMFILGAVAACSPSTTASPAESTASGSSPAATASQTNQSPPPSPAGPSPTPSLTCAPVATSSVSASATPGTDVAAPTLTGVTAASGPCGDQVIFEVSGVSSVGYRIEYKDQLLGIGSGIPIPVRGGAVLVVNLEAPAYDDAGQSTYSPSDRANLVSTAGLSSVRQVAWAGSFEGYSLIGIGVDRIRPFSVSVMAGSPTRVIVQISPQALPASGH